MAQDGGGQNDGSTDAETDAGIDADVDAEVDATADAGGDADAGASDVGQLASVSAGENFTCALYTTGHVYCFGGNDNGQLGRGDTTDVGGEPGTMSGLHPIDLGTGAIATQIAAGGHHACALLAGGSVKCWGANSRGELGLGDGKPRGDKPGQMGDALPAITLGAAKRIAAGATWTCAILEGGSVKCWGSNANGQLGLGVGTPFIGDDAGEMAALASVDLGPGRTATDLALGEQHSCALLDNQTVKCWGGNGEGQLGQGDTQVRGNKANQMGANLPAIALGTERKAKSLWAGGFHNCALLDDDSVKCWGGNVAGQLGIGTTVNRGDAAGQMDDALAAIDFGAGRKAKQMHLGQEFSCALLDDASLKCFGNNFFGQLGYGDTAKRGDGANEMGDQLPAVDLGPGAKTRAVAGGPNHVCALSIDAKLRCWGANISGQLGVGDRNARGDSPTEMGAALSPLAIP